MVRLAAAYRVVAGDLREVEPGMTRELQKMIMAHQVGRLDGEVSDSLDRSSNAAGRMETLIRDLLDYAKVRTEGKELVPTSCTESVGVSRSNARSQN